ncbi:Sugar phosphate isomerase/epimerase [bacterium A37T11]|nr:Sugar phosphate isomerase/epimerase [bacterium A37T11]
MEVKFFCPRWGFENVAWEDFLPRVKQAGYAGIEWFPQVSTAESDEVPTLLRQQGLAHIIVMTVNRQWCDVDEYLNYLDEDLQRLLGIGAGTLPPLFLSVQPGREYFTAGQKEACIGICREAELRTGIPIYLETHRNKWTYAAHATLPVLQKHPELSLTLDISHWYCVSESYLEDQAEAVDAAIAHAKHVHARVGHMEGPQVVDPAFTEYQEALQAHLTVWDRWVNAMEKSGHAAVTFTPEFGPPPYLPMAGRPIDPQQEQWRLNLWIKNLLQTRYQPHLHE